MSDSRPRAAQRHDELRLPGCEQAKNETALLLSHPYLLAEPEYIEQLLGAVEKVNGDLAGDEEAVRGVPG